MVKYLTDKEISNAIDEFTGYVQSRVRIRMEERVDYIHEIVVQAFYELDRHREIVDPLGHLKMCYPNLCKRARSEQSKLFTNSMVKGDTEVSYIEDCQIEEVVTDADWFVIFEDCVNAIRTELTDVQLVVFDYLIDNVGASRSDMWRVLGYQSEAGLRQIAGRIRERAMPILRQQ